MNLPAMRITVTLILTFALLLLMCFTGCKSKAGSSDYDDEAIMPETPKEHKSQVNTDSSSTAEGKVIKYNYNWSAGKDFPPVCIVIDDFGYVGGKLLQGFAELDEEVTFAVLPDLPNSTLSAKTANIHGHEVILHIPMEALDTKQSPGKSYIKSTDSAERVVQLMNAYLDQVPQALGANNHMGSRVTGDYKTMKTVLETLKNKGLFFLDSRTNPKSRVLNAVTDLKMDYAARDIFLDVPDVSAANLNAKLNELEKFKGRKEPVIIISHCHNQSKLEAMRSFITQLKGMGIRLIPLSEAVKDFNLPA